MKKIVSIVASLALAGGAAIATAAPAQALTNNDRLFAKLVRAEAYEFKAVPVGAMVKTAKTTCKFLRSGFTVIDAVSIMEDNGISEDAAIAFVAGAVVFYCPEQKDNY